MRPLDSIWTPGALDAAIFQSQIGQLVVGLAIGWTLEVVMVLTASRTNKYHRVCEEIE